jgi:hypothetical protein
MSSIDWPASILIVDDSVVARLGAKNVLTHRRPDRLHTFVWPFGILRELINEFIGDALAS